MSTKEQEPSDEQCINFTSLYKKALLVYVEIIVQYISHQNIFNKAGMDNFKGVDATQLTMLMSAAAGLAVADCLPTRP